MCVIYFGQCTLQLSFNHLPVNGRGLVSAKATLMLVKNIDPKPVGVVSLSATRCFLAFGLFQDNANLAVDTAQPN